MEKLILKSNKLGKINLLIILNVLHFQRKVEEMCSLTLSALKLASFF